MVITQITAVLEPIYAGESLFWNNDATIFGIGDDQKMYYWGRTKTTTVKHDEPDEDGETEHYEHEWGWILHQP